MSCLSIEITVVDTYLLLRLGHQKDSTGNRLIKVKSCGKEREKEFYNETPSHDLCCKKSIPAVKCDA